MVKFTTRRATSADEPLIQRFIEETYGPTAPFKGKQRSYWQFVENPFRPNDEIDPTIWIAVSENKVVGQIAVQDGQLHVNGDDRPAGWIVDVMVHPNFRGLGLGHRIHDTVVLERSTLVTLTMAPATRRIAERAGCVTLPPTRLLVKPIHISHHTVNRYFLHRLRSRPKLAALMRLLKKTIVGPMLASWAVNFIGAFSCGNPKNRLIDTSNIEEVNHFSSEIDELWNTAKRAHPPIFNRSTRFLNWRFVDVPALSYRRFVLRRDGIITGYVVTRSSQTEELPHGVIVDLLAHPDDPETIDTLISHAIRVLSPSSEYIEAAASIGQYLSAYKRMGFWATKTMRPTVVSRDTKVSESLNVSAPQWHFSKADHDWDQVHPV